MVGSRLLLLIEIVLPVYCTGCAFVPPSRHNSLLSSAKGATELMVKKKDSSLADALLLQFWLHKEKESGFYCGSSAAVEIRRSVIEKTDIISPDAVWELGAGYGGAHYVYI